MFSKQTLKVSRCCLLSAICAGASLSRVVSQRASQKKQNYDGAQCHRDLQGEVREKVKARDGQHGG